ncbi:MAG: hypothetical protein WAK22_10350 [Candidatus Sulfotelmatobacter sp.]
MHRHIDNPDPVGHYVGIGCDFLPRISTHQESGRSFGGKYV